MYDYAVPDLLVSQIQVGLKVNAPLGSRTVEAYIIEIIESAPGADEEQLPLFSGIAAHSLPAKSFKLRHLYAILDPLPFFYPGLIKLARWIAGYYCAPFSLALRCMLPAAVRSRTMRAKEQLYVEPQSGDFKLTKRQSELLNEIRRVGGGWITFLTREFACSPQTIRNLEKSGAVVIEQRQMRRDPLANRKILPTKAMPLMDEQSAALDVISDLIKRSGKSEKTIPLLLHGVTGSGKTEVYLQAIAEVLEMGRGAIVLVPEIALTPQTVQRFAARFGNRIAVLHSALSEGKRFDEWHRIRKGDADVVIGARSALFAPLRNLGLIVVDEEHEPSYKQDETPRYHARDVAVVRGMMENCVVILGTATPSMESWHNAQTGKYKLLTMAKRVSDRPMPHVHIVDMRMVAGSAGHAMIFSTPLLDAIKERIERGEQSILFLNRRGFSNSLQCTKCGYVFECKDCSVPYTYHAEDTCLRCHVCAGWKHLPSACPGCNEPVLKYAGYGTQRVEKALRSCFPKARILRMDADVTARRSSHDELLDIFKNRDADILLGTQMIAKGLDFPNVTLVGVINADMSLHMPDIRAAERTWQLLAQVSGRAGRAHLPGEVFIQTYSPDHLSIRVAGGSESFETLAKQELAERREGGYPPFTHMICLTFKGRIERQCATFAQFFARELSRVGKGSMRVSDAIPAPLSKARGYYRYQVLLRSTSVKKMNAILNKLITCQKPREDVKIIIDVDAINLM